MYAETAMKWRVRREFKQYLDYSIYHDEYDAINGFLNQFIPSSSSITFIYELGLEFIGDQSFSIWPKSELRDMRTFVSYAVKRYLMDNRVFYQYSDEKATQTIAPF